jgi:hypothetical protein
MNKLTKPKITIKKAPMAKPKIVLNKAPIVKESNLRLDKTLIILEKKDKPTIMLKASVYKWRVIMTHIDTIEKWLNGENLDEVIDGFTLKGGFAFVSNGKCSKGFGITKAKWIIEHKYELKELI